MSTDHIFGQILSPVVSEASVSLMLQHWQLVCQWQKRTNLTGITDATEAAWCHYRDALAILPHWPQGASILDIGSGAGFPGLVLAMARPDAAVTLLEPRHKRASFLRFAQASLQLKNVRVEALRLDQFAPEAHDLIVTRAVFSDDADLAGAMPHLSADGQIVAYRQGELGAEHTSGPLWRWQAARYPLGPYTGTRRLDVWIPPTHPAYKKPNSDT